MLSIFEIATLLLALSALFGWFNVRFLKLPNSIGLLIMALAGSLLLILMEEIIPAFGVTRELQAAIGQIDFYSTIMEGMLSFLLFAGALHVDLDKLKDQKWAVGLMASIGVIISTAVVAAGIWWAASLIGLNLPFVWALVFGALISPTDPVAVLGLLKTINIPESIKAKIAGEALFNDGVAVVAFSVLVAVALESGGEASMTVWHVAELFFYEGFGGAAFGLLTGFIAYRAMLSIDDHIVEILISIALCVVTYTLSLRLHISGPIAVVVAGILIGNRGAAYAMSEKVEQYLFAFWEVVDELLNSVLFLLIGLEVLVLSFAPSYALIMLLAIPVVLFARLVSILVPVTLLSRRQPFSTGSVPILTWGGLRGGVSVALALSLPESESKPVILAVTYAVVIFSIVVQGLTVKRVIGRALPRVANE